jgi:hypothetical protein
VNRFALGMGVEIFFGLPKKLEQQPDGPHLGGTNDQIILIIDLF